MTVAVLDIGKTNLKLLLFDAAGEILAERLASNRAIEGPPWLALDLAHIERFLLDGLRTFADDNDVRHIVTASHGSAAVLIDDEGPLLPPIDYEARVPKEVLAEHARLAPPFPERGAGFLGGASHLARQLLWVRATAPDILARATAYLPLPQYLAWRLTGRVGVDWTMLGAQSHLWSPLQHGWTSLAQVLDVTRLFPHVGPPWRSLGRAHDDLGLPEGLEVLAGIHDSTANLYRYQRAGLERFTLLSSGTWLVGMSADTPSDCLDERRFMGLTVDVEGRTIAGTLAMAGRERALLAGESPAPVTLEALERVIAADVMALPSFVDTDGVYPGSAGKGQLIGTVESDADRAALATLYTALVAETCLELLATETTVIVDGGFTAEPAFAGLLAALRSDLGVFASPTGDGTARGAALLASHEHGGRREVDLRKAAPLMPAGLAAYATRWRERAG